MTAPPDTEHYDGPFDLHHDDEIWEAGYEFGIKLAVVITHDSGVNEAPLKAVEAQSALRAACGNCMVCGSDSAIKFEPRRPGRSAIWLCRRDLDRFLQRHHPFPDEDPDPVNPLLLDEPVWFAGLLTALSQVTPMVKTPRARETKKNMAFWERMARAVKRETCSLCPGYGGTWVGSSGIYGVTICGLCLEYLRERRALILWTSPGDRVPEHE